MEPENEISSVVSLKDYWSIFRRRRKVILQAFVLFSVAGIVVTLVMRPVYQASAKLLVEGQSLRMNTVDTSNPLASLLALTEPQAVETQVEVLQAQPLLDQVQHDIGYTRVDVHQIRDTNVIEVVAEAHTPGRAAGAANRLLDLYIQQDSDQNLVEIRAAKDFVTSQEAQARDRVNAADTALKNFKEKNDLEDVIRNRDDQISLVGSLTTDYQKNQDDIASTDAQIARVQKQLDDEPMAVATTMQSTNPAIANTLDDIHKLETTRQGMVQPGGYTDSAPSVRAIDAQIAEQKHYLATLPALIGSQTSQYNTVRDGLRSQIHTLDQQLSALETQARIISGRLLEAKAKVSRFANWQVTYDQLAREQDDALAADKMLSDRLLDLSLRAKAGHATARVIESADIPDKPVRPKKLLNIVLSCIVGLFAGCILAMLQEYLDDRINSEEDAERVLGLISLGRIPPLSGSQGLLLPQMTGLDTAAESYRILRTNIHFASIDRKVRSLQITSSAPGEGKTTTSANLAFAMVQDGKKVILVDTDLRRPSMHTLLEIPTSPGLTDVLLGNATLEQALRTHESMPGLTMLPVGAIPPNPAELLGSRALKDVVQQLTDRADIVIFDSPPVLVAADAQILASQMDGVVIVVETAETRKGAAKQTLKLLRQARANVLGIAYNMMMMTNDGSGYYHYYYYHPYTSKNPESLTDGSSKNGSHKGGGNGSGSGSGGNLVATKERSKRR
jgi:capsular exopolysaccharide synthesis family protein